MRSRTTKLTTSCDICKTCLDTDKLQIITYYPVYFAKKTRVFCLCRGCYQEIDSMNYEQIMQYIEEKREGD
jgi:hypothetical protein